MAGEHYRCLYRPLGLWSVIHIMGFDDYFYRLGCDNYAHQHHIQTGLDVGQLPGALVAYVLEIKTLRLRTIYYLSDS